MSVGGNNNQRRHIGVKMRSELKAFKAAFKRGYRAAFKGAHEMPKNVTSAYVVGFNAGNRDRSNNDGYGVSVPTSRLHWENV